MDKVLAYANLIRGMMKNYPNNTLIIVEFKMKLCSEIFSGPTPERIFITNHIFWELLQLKLFLDPRENGVILFFFWFSPRRK